MAATKTSGNTTANPIEDATKKVAELNEEATQKVTALETPRSWPSSSRRRKTRPSS